MYIQITDYKNQNQYLENINEEAKYGESSEDIQGSIKSTSVRSYDLNRDSTMGKDSANSEDFDLASMSSSSSTGTNTRVASQLKEFKEIINFS